MESRRITEDVGGINTLASGGGGSRKPLALLFLAALALRVVHVATIVHSPFFSRLSLDPLAYHEWGVRIAAGSWLGDRIFYQDPLYPYFLGVLYALFGTHHVLVVLVQALAGACVPLFVHRAAEPWLGRATALVAGWTAALYAPAIYYEGLILKSWMELFLMAAALAALSFAARSTSLRAWLAAGVLIGIGCLVRANFLLLLPCLAAWAALDPSAWRAASRVARGKAALALLAGGAIVLVPTALRNRIVGGEWVLTTAQAGQNFYLGNNPFNHNGEYEPLPFVAANPKHEEQDFAREAERRTLRPMSPTEVSRFWFHEGFSWIGGHPRSWLHLLWKKTRVFWSAYEVPDNLDYYLYLESAPLLRLPLPGFGLVAPLGLVGAGWLLRRPGWPRALLIVLVVYSGSVILFYVFARYRLAMMPVLFPFAGYAMVQLVRAARAALRRAAPARKAAIPAVTIAAALAVVNLPVRAPESYWTYRIAHAVGLPVQAETTATAHYNLGLAYAREAQSASDPRESLARAEEELREALRQDRRFAKVYVELGKVLARSGKEHEAIEMYEASLSVEPLLWRTHHSLGLLYRRVGEKERAEAAFRRAAELEPRQADSLAELGNLYLEEGRTEDARQAFTSALRISPDHEAARAGLRSMPDRP